MKKALTIHIAEKSYTIDDDAYSQLEAYLADLQQYFAKEASEEETKEIIEDIEIRIAEILDERLGEENNIVSVSEVEYIQKEMGTIDDIAKEEGEAHSAEVSNKETSTWKPGKKLYRDTEEGIIAGVSAGIAAYLDIDVVFIRIAFLLLLLLNGVGIIAYIIMWLAMPEAITPGQKAAMHGKRSDISSIEKNVKKRLSEGLTEADKKELQTGLQRVYGLLREFFQGLGRLLKMIVPIIGTIIAVLFAIAGGLIIAASTVAVVTQLTAPDNAMLGPIHEIIQMVQATNTLFIGSLYVTIWSIGILFILIANQIQKKGKSSIGWLTSLVLFIFFISAIATVTMGIQYAPDIEEEYNAYIEENNITATKQFTDVEQFSGVYGAGAIEVDISYGPTQTVELVADREVIDDYIAVVQNGMLSVERKDHFQVCFIWCRRLRPTQLLITTPSLEHIELSGASEAYLFESEEMIATGNVFTVELSGASMIDIEDIEAKKMIIDASGASSVYVEGTTQELDVDASGSSSIYAVSLEAVEADVDVSGASDARVNVSEALVVEATGASSVEYAGDPSLKSGQSGASDIRKIQ